MKNVRMLFSVLMAVLLACSLSLFAYAAVGGDVNGDGKLANDDLSTLVSFLSGHGESVRIANLDVDNNGSVNNRDAIAIAQALAGWDVYLYTGIGADGSDIDVGDLR
jgi:hypothetical protein